MVLIKIPPLAPGANHKKAFSGWNIKALDKAFTAKPAINSKQAKANFGAFRFNKDKQIKIAPVQAQAVMMVSESR